MYLLFVNLVILIINVSAYAAFIAEILFLFNNVKSKLCCLAAAQENILT